MISSEALKILNTNTSPKIETINLDFIAKFNASMVEKTLSWAKSIIPFSLIENTGLRELCQLTKVSSQDSFNTQPLMWGLSLIETQVTKAIRLFLDDDTKFRKQRIESFLIAFDVELPDEETEYYIANEHIFKGGRFDIMIAWGLNGQKYNRGLICEFKLGSAIHDGQLSKYEGAAPQFIDNPTFAFISQKYKKADFKALKNTSEPWILRLWWKFLRDWENCISHEIDDFEFRQFRATLWEQLA